MKYNLGLVLFTFSSLVSSQNIDFPLEDPVDTIEDPQGEIDSNSYTGFHGQFGTVIGEKWVKEGNKLYLKAKGLDTTNHVSEFYAGMEPLSQNALDVGTNTKVPFVTYNEMTGLLSAELPAVGFDDLSIAPKYITPAKSSPVDLFDPFAGSSGQLGVGWHFGLGHLVVQRRPMVERIWGPDGDKSCAWQSQGYERIYRVDSAGRESQFAKQYLTLDESAFEHLGVKKHSVFPGSSRHSNEGQGVHVYYSKQRETSLVNMSGDVLTRTSSNSQWNINPPSASNASCDPIDMQLPNEAKVLTKTEQNKDNWFQEYGWFDFTLNQPDGSKVIYRAELDSIDKANLVASKTVNGELGEGVNINEKVFFHPVEIIQPNGASYTIEYEGDGQCATSGYSHCIGSRQIKSIKKTGAHSSKSSELQFSYTEQGMIDAITLVKNNTSVQLAKFNYATFDSEQYLTSFTDAQSRIFKMFYDDTAHQGARWLTGIADPLSAATNAAQATTYIQYADVTNVPVGAFFPRGCSMRPATVDYSVTGMYLDGMNQWSLNTLDDPSRDGFDAACDPILFGEGNYNKRRVSTLKYADKLVSFNYQHQSSTEVPQSPNPSHEVHEVDYQLLANNTGAFNQDRNFTCHPNSNYPCLDGDNLKLKVDALYKVTKQTSSQYETETTTTYYASYNDEYHYPASRKMGLLAGKPLIQVTQVENSRAAGVDLGSDFKNTLRKEWYWDFIDVSDNLKDEFEPGTFGGNPVTRKFRAGVKLIKQASAVFNGDLTNPDVIPNINNAEAHYTLYNYGGIKTNVDGKTSPTTFTSTRLKALYAKPKSIYSISKLGIEPANYYSNTYEKSISELKYTSNYSFSIGNDDFSVFQMMLPVSKTVCHTRASSCSLTDPSTRILARTESQYQSYSALNGLYLPDTSKAYRDGSVASNISPLVASYQFFTDNAGFENKGMLSSFSSGSAQVYFNDYIGGSPTQVKNWDWDSAITSQTELTSSGFVTVGNSRSGAVTRTESDLIGRVVAANTNGFLGSVVSHVETAGVGLEVSENLAGSMVTAPISTSTFDVSGNMVSTEQRYTDALVYSNQHFNTKGIGLYEKVTNPKGGVTEVFKDILARPVFVKTTAGSTKNSETQLSYGLVGDTAANGLVTYHKVSDRHHQVFNSSVYDLQQGEHFTHTQTNLLGEVTKAKQCNGSDSQCGSDNVEIDYQSVTHADPYFNQTYVGVLKQTAKVKNHQTGEYFGERVKISDLLGNLLYESNPETGETYFLYDDLGRIYKSRTSAGLETTHVYQADVLKRIEFDNTADSAPKYIVEYHYDNANGRLASTESYYEGESTKVIEVIEHKAQTDMVSAKTVSVPEPSRGPQDLRPRYIENYDALDGKLILRWNSDLAHANYQLELTNKSLSADGELVSVLFDNISTNSFELTTQKLSDVITAQLGSESAWLAEFGAGADPLLASSNYEWRVLGYNKNTFEPFASSQKSTLTSECQILEFEAVKGYQQGPLIKWDTRGCEGLTTAVLVTTHTVAKNHADLNDDCRIDDGVFSGYKRGPQRAHFLYNGYNKADIIAAEEGDSSSTPVWTGAKECFGSPTVPHKRLDEVSFRLSVREGGSDGLIKNKQELFSSRNIIAKLDYDENACHIRNFQVKHGEGELIYNTSTGQWNNDGTWSAPSVTWEAVNCDHKYFELKVNAIDTKCPVNELIAVEQAGRYSAETLSACGNDGGASFQLEIREASNFDANVIDESQTLEAMNAPHLTIAGGCYISDFAATDGDDSARPTVTWKTVGCDDKDVNVVYNAVQPGVDVNCQLRDYLFVNQQNGENVEAAFMYQPYVVDASGQRVQASTTTPNACEPMKSADVWLEVREQNTGVLVADKPPIDVAYTGQWEASCGIQDFSVNSPNLPGQLPTVTWVTDCQSDVSVQVLTTVTGSADAQCDLAKQLWDGNKSGSREVTFMLGGYANNCPPVAQANFEVQLVNPVNGAVLETSQVESVTYQPSIHADKACELTSFRAIDRGDGLLPAISIQANRSGCSADFVKVMYQPVDAGLSTQCRTARSLGSFYSSYYSLADQMLATANCPAVTNAKVWVEQYYNDEMIAHSSFVDLNYSHEQTCNADNFNVNNPTVPGQLPVVSWTTGCTGQSVQVKTSTITQMPAECMLNGALWDGNKNLSSGRTVDFMVGGWGVTPSLPNGCPATAQADFWLEIYDGGNLIDTSEVKRATFDPVTPPCELNNSSFYVEGTGANSSPKVHYYTNCSVSDASVHVMFSYSGDDQKHELYDFSQSGGNGLDVYKLTAGKPDGWVWIEIRDLSASKNLLRRTDFKKADFGMAANAQSLISTSPLSANENNQ